MRPDASALARTIKPAPAASPASSHLAIPIDQARAERIGRSHPCSRCLEYSFKKLVVKPATASHRTELGAVWIVTRTCGVCALDEELALDAEGDIIYG